jgi:hypothetical protein
LIFSLKNFKILENFKQKINQRNFEKDIKPALFNRSQEPRNLDRALFPTSWILKPSGIINLAILELTYSWHIFIICGMEDSLSF